MNNLLALGATLVLCALLFVLMRLIHVAFGFRRLGVASAAVQILAVLLAVFSVIFSFMPAIPCEPVRISLGRHGSASVTVDTLNYALPYLLAFALALLSVAGFCFYCLTPAYRKDLMGRGEKRPHRHGRNPKGRSRRAEIPDRSRSTVWGAEQKLLLMAVALLFLAVSALIIYKMTTL